MNPNQNARNQLQELVQALGWPLDLITVTFGASPSGHSATVRVQLTPALALAGAGEGWRRSHAEIAACASALTDARDRHPNLWPDWEAMRADAQAGDALIKLAVYRANAHQTAAERCAQLQQIESDARLADVYDRWRTRDEPDLGVFGPDLGRKAKATVVEAIIWRRHVAAVETLAGELDALLDAISR